MSGSSLQKHHSRLFLIWFQYLILIIFYIHHSTAIPSLKGAKDILGVGSDTVENLSPTTSIGTRTSARVSKGGNQPIGLNDIKSKKASPTGFEIDDLRSTKVDARPTQAHDSTQARVSIPDLLTGPATERYHEPGFGNIPPGQTGMAWVQPPGLQIC